MALMLRSLFMWWLIIFSSIALVLSLGTGQWLGVLKCAPWLWWGLHLHKTRPMKLNTKRRFVSGPSRRA